MMIERDTMSPTNTSVGETYTETISDKRSYLGRKAIATGLVTAIATLGSANIGTGANAIDGAHRYEKRSKYSNFDPPSWLVMKDMDKNTPLRKGDLVSAHAARGYLGILNDQAVICQQSQIQPAGQGDKLFNPPFVYRTTFSVRPNAKYARVRLGLADVASWASDSGFQYSCEVVNQTWAEVSASRRKGKKYSKPAARPKIAFLNDKAGYPGRKVEQVKDNLEWHNILVKLPSRATSSALARRSLCVRIKVTSEPRKNHITTKQYVKDNVYEDFDPDMKLWTDSPKKKSRITTHCLSRRNIKR